jgi:glycine/D-amino acid oxidase-like deaminating enzyme
VTAVTDVALSTLIDRIGPEHALAVWDAGFAAMARIRANVRDERINCEFGWVPGYLHAAPGTDPGLARATMSQEAAAADVLGIDALYLDAVPGVGRPGVMFRNQARMHPLKYLEVLTERIHGDGSFVFEESEVSAVEEAPLAVRVGRHRIRARYVVMATHVPAVRNVWSPQGLTTRRSYVVRGIARAGTVGEGLYWEHVDGVYEHLRVDRRNQHDEVIIGRLDQAADIDCDEEASFRTLEARLHARVPDARVTHRWRGHVTESPDGLPCIGEIAPRLFAATAFGGNATTFGTLAGMMAADAAMGRANPWQELFEIRRARAVVGGWGSASATREYPYYTAGQCAARSGSGQPPTSHGAALAWG